jgi:sodium/bile acid cotransporter 7
MKFDGFLIAIAAAVGLALLWPELGTSDGPLHLALVARIGIAFIFFLHGAALSPQALRSGAAHWRLHLLVQSTTFILFPLMGGIVWLATAGIMPDGLRLGFFYLCALSSTISSSIAMTALARGNVAVAVFNATLSGLIGMIATPLLVGLVSTLGANGPSVGDAILDIAKTLLLPFAIGQACRSLIGPLIARHKKFTSVLDRGVIVLIVYSSFSDSTASGLWSQFSVATLALVVGLSLLLLILALLYTTGISRKLGFSRADEAAAVFCGSKKSLANGAPIAKILFAGNPAIGMIMLPMLIYHQIQLIVCASLARRYAATAAAVSREASIA